MDNAAQWIPVPGFYTVTDGIATQVVPAGTDVKKRFYKVEIQ